MEFERVMKAASAQLELGRLVEARKLLDRAQAISEDFPAPDVRRADVLRELGMVAAAGRDFAGAESHLMQSILLREQLPEGAANGIIETLDRLAYVLKLAGKLERAEAVATTAQERRVAAVGPRDIRVADGLVALADIRLARGNPRGAESVLLEALDIRREAHGPEHVAVAQVTAAIGRVCLHRGRLTQAESHLGTASALYEKLAPRSLDRAVVVEDLAEILVKSERLGDAEVLLELAIRIRTEAPRCPPEDIAATMRRQADLLKRTGREDEATVLEERAAKLVADRPSSRRRSRAGTPPRPELA